MGQIRQMDEHLATLIAVGEVVAGPVSVVRELVDNALDAGATSVDIAVEEGGLRSIRVADNGSGMDEEDAVLCMSRHATSKVATPDDLASIRTLGFRGEALAAILSVSHVRVETQRADSAAGTSVRGAGGAIHETRPVGRRPGTTVEVSHLFFNTPARREFQDSERAEAARVLGAVQRVAIARPDVRFTYRDGEREVLNLPAAGDPLERIRQVHGDDFADALLPLRGERGEVRVTGWVTRPSAAVRRARRSCFVVNGRPFESYEIRRLVTTTFAPVVSHGHHAEAIVRIELPPGEVDVNVSPDKSQVRFRLPGQVLAAVTDALRHALGERDATRSFAPGEAAADGAPARPPGVPPDVAARIAALRRYEEQSSGQPDAWERMFGEDREARQAAPAGWPMRVAERRNASLVPDEWVEPRAEESASPAPRHGIPADPAQLVQVGNTFLVCAVDDGMLIVDQHSAHERVNYERLRAQWEQTGRNPDVQPLMFPEALALEADRMALLEEMRPLLERAGFELSPAGPRQMLVQAVPAALGDRSPLRALEALTDAYAEARSLGARSGEVGEAITPVEDRVLMTMACHAAVKAGQRLTEAELRSLWRDLVRVDLAAHDVHGRPAVLHLPTSEIARRMGRGT